MVGVLAAGVVRPPCHAVLLNDRQIVTAAHCFVSRNGTETPLGAAFRSRDLVFIPNGGPRALVAYDPLRQMPWKTFVDGRQKRADDFAILELATPAAPALAIDGYARVLGLGDRLFSPAYWLEAGAGDTLYADRWDDLCRVAAATDKCFVHTCTTMPGISGAPVFKIETNAAGDPTGPIFLAGIHNGAAKISREEEGRACGPELTDPTAGSLQDFNVGVTAARVCQSGSADRQSGVCSAAAGSFN
ncbi:MAG: trypsin-like peptidase domain-containing protein [Parvularculaceae bacterium]